jgi:hypothetical protein
MKERNDQIMDLTIGVCDMLATVWTTPTLFKNLTTFILANKLFHVIYIFSWQTNWKKLPHSLLSKELSWTCHSLDFNPNVNCQNHLALVDRPHVQAKCQSIGLQIVSISFLNALEILAMKLFSNKNKLYYDVILQTCTKLIETTI